jgi:hypothetical protein
MGRDWQLRRYLQRERREQTCALDDEIWLETRKHICHARHIQTIRSLARDTAVRAQAEELSPLRRHFAAADELQVRGQPMLRDRLRESGSQVSQP